MPIRTRASGLLLVVCAGVVAGCSANRELVETKRAFLRASYELRLPYRGQTHDEVAKDLELFLDRDADRIRARTLELSERHGRAYRFFAIGGGLVAAIGAFAGIWNLGGLGLAVGLAGYVPYSSRISALTECRLFVISESAALREWGRTSLRPGAGPVPPELWREYVDRTHRVVSHETCLVVE